MATISLCMIVRDEEPVLARCLESVREAVDEIILVDTGSADRTKAIARQFTEKVYDFPWIDDFAAARNFSFSKAEMDYQMWLDADDVLTPESVQQLIALKEHLTADVVMLPYHVAFDAQGTPVLSYYRERLLRRERQFRWEGAVHEAITPAGTVIYGEAAVCHRKEHVNDPDRNLRIFEKQLAEGKPLKPREQYYYARELLYHKRYRDAVGVFTEFLAEPSAWLEDRIGACALLAECHEALGETEEALMALFRSFCYDRPRAEICCEIGRLKLEQGSYTEAIFWYEAAAAAPFTEDGFQKPDRHDYIPYMQLCVCYDRLGNIMQAKAYNDKAGRIKPQDANYLANKRYFRSKLRS